ncbi:DMT family transporter (plasmid) [Tistrella bauzanensis]|uniref:DMT family transporter n=1 Tax=Tistrella TaxID=171436 RepID=UPI0031F6A7A1
MRLHTTATSTAEMAMALSALLVAASGALVRVADAGTLVIMGVGLGLPSVLVWVVAALSPSLRPSFAQPLVLARAVFCFGSIFGTFAAVARLDLGVVYAVNLAAPLTAAAIGAVIFAEPLPPARRMAGLLALGGTVLALMPSLPDGDDAGLAVAALGVSFVSTVLMVLTTRAMGRAAMTTASTMVSLAHVGIASAVMMCVTSWPVLAGPQAVAVALPLAAGVVTFLAVGLAAVAYRLAPLANAAPVECLKPVFALGIAAVAFGEAPEPRAVAGIGLVVLALVVPHLPWPARGLPRRR